VADAFILVRPNTGSASISSKVPVFFPPSYILHFTSCDFLFITVKFLSLPSQGLRQISALEEVTFQVVARFHVLKLSSRFLDVI
jgi:hypothetical protein